MVLDGLVDGAFHVAGDLLHPIGGFAALFSNATGEVFGLTGDLTKLVGGLIGDFLELVGCLCLQVLGEPVGWPPYGGLCADMVELLWGELENAFALFWFKNRLFLKFKVLGERLGMTSVIQRKSG